MSVYKPTYRRGGKRVRGRFYMAGLVLDGRRYRFSTARTDKRAAEARAKEMQKILERDGPDAVRNFLARKDTTRDTLLEDFETWFKTSKFKKRTRNPIHVEKTIMRAKWMLQGLHDLTRLSADIIEKRIAVLQATGHSDATVNGYRAALLTFCRWLVREGHIETNPMDRVGGISITNRTRERRALTRDELDALVEVAPEHRGTIYLLAARTGLRRGEMNQLRWADFNLLDAVVHVRAEIAKGRREDWLPLPPDLLKRLRLARARARDLERAFVVPTMVTMRGDLKAAGIAYKTDQGVADMHALRTTFVTNLARAGAPLQSAQKLARHCTPELTANVYTRLRLDDLRAASDAAEAGTSLLTPVLTDVDRQAPSDPDSAESAAS